MSLIIVCDDCGDELRLESGARITSDELQDGRLGLAQSEGGWWWVGSRRCSACQDAIAIARDAAMEAVLAERRKLKGGKA